MSPLIFAPLPIALGRAHKFLKVHHALPDRQPHLYRSQNTLIDGKPVFFGATIEENLRKVNPGISERELQEILEISGLQKVLDQLQEGMSTEINQFGMPLSQGDRVTLALARGLIAMPRILLIDEALANLDKSTQISFF